MIAGLYGKIETIATDSVILNTNGVCFRVLAPASTINQLGHAGTEVYLHTHLHLREDNVSLYGFATTEELTLFEYLITVSGLGPAFGADHPFLSQPRTTGYRHYQRQRRYA